MEILRLSDLALLASEDRYSLQATVDVAVQLLRVPVALVTVIDTANDRQVFVADRGLAEPYDKMHETPLDLSVCRHVLTDPDPLVIEDVLEGGMALMPIIGRARLLRAWGGLVDMSMDGSPIIDRTDIDGLYFNGAWNYGGFKATPAAGLTFAHLLATDTPHDTATAFRFDRFNRGYVIDEKGVGAQPNLH